MKNRQKAFTLIEILTVIAIMIILFGLGMSVYPRAKLGSFKAADLSRLNQISSAVNLYNVDQGGYPPALLGYATLYASGPASDVVPANRTASYLFPRRISSVDVFKPSRNQSANDLITPVTWPHQDPRPLGTGAQYDVTGDGQIDMLQDDPADARQAFGPTDGCVTMSLGVDPTCSPSGGSAYYYTVSGFDLAKVPDDVAGNPAIPYHLRYTLFWTVSGVGPGSATDDSRQLGYSNPPDSTIMTWNSFNTEFVRDAQGSPRLPEMGRHDQVLTVGGAARPADSRALFARSWRFVP